MKEIRVFFDTGNFHLSLLKSLTVVQRTIYLFRAIIFYILRHFTLLANWVPQVMTLEAPRPMHHLIAPFCGSSIGHRLPPTLHWLTFTNNGRLVNLG